MQVELELLHTGTHQSKNTSAEHLLAFYKTFDEVKHEKYDGMVITGHSEYDADTLKQEYLRDKKAGLPIDPPRNYFPQDDDTQDPMVTWRAHANLLYFNWLNYFVYQTTPYNISEL